MKYELKSALLVIGFAACLSGCGRDEAPASKSVKDIQVPVPVFPEARPELGTEEFQEDKTSQNETPQPVAEDLVPPTEPTFSVAEVSLHNSRKDCWIIIGDSVYDITNFFETHPGGEAPVRFCGRDATAVFSRIHDGSVGADFMAQQYRIGRLLR